MQARKVFFWLILKSQKLAIVEGVLQRLSIHNKTSKILLTGCIYLQRRTTTVDQVEQMTSSMMKIVLSSWLL